MAKAKVLRELLQTPGVHQGPACFDAIGAKLIESAGFPYCITSGFSIAASRLALPDTGFVSYGEMLDQCQLIAQAVSIPIIADADNGYGNAMNLKRTVKGFISAGFAGILLEDQVTYSLLFLFSHLPFIHSLFFFLMPDSNWTGCAESVWAHSRQEGVAQGRGGDED